MLGVVGEFYLERTEEAKPLIYRHNNFLFFFRIVLYNDKSERCRVNENREFFALINVATRRDVRIPIK